jgi:ABC-type sugar transport system permease subunit
MRASAKWHPHAMLAPTLALLFVFFIFPLGIAVYSSFFAWDMLTLPTYVGFDNYAAIAHDGEVVRILGRTLGFACLVVTGSMVLGLGLALLVNRAGRVFAFVRGAIFSAYVVSWVAVALLWMWLLDGNFGIAGEVMHVLGVQRRALLGDPETALVTIAFVSVWKVTGYAMIVFLAGLQGVPRALVEAAALDGASAWQRFHHVTWPHLRPMAAFVGTTSLVASFQAFDVVRIMTQGGPANATRLFVYAIYEQIFLNLSVGKASALTVVFFVVLLALAMLQLRAWRIGGRAT